MRLNPSVEKDERFMREALALAHQRLGLTSPNPAVGCVIVRGERIVGRGATAAGGRPHAETEAINEAGRNARRATAYVSLEPCAHQGKTSSCARALVQAGVARVVTGCLDPYPPVRGRGVAILRRAGIEVTVGVLEEQCRGLNEGFITRVTRRRPFALLKLALTLDGRIAARSGDSRWISSDESRNLVHQWRQKYDVVMVGAGTVIADDPRLTCRIPDGRDPVRVVVDANLRCDPSSRIFRQRSKAPTFIATAEGNVSAAERRYGAAATLGVAAKDGRLDLHLLMRELARRGWSKVMIEGGAHLAGAALAAGIIDRIAFFYAPKILGDGLPAVSGLLATSMRSAIKLTNLRAHPIGPDYLLEAEVSRNR